MFVPRSLLMSQLRVCKRTQALVSGKFTAFPQLTNRFYSSSTPVKNVEPTTPVEQEHGTILYRQSQAVTIRAMLAICGVNFIVSIEIIYCQFQQR